MFRTHSQSHNLPTVAKRDYKKDKRKTTFQARIAAKKDAKPIVQQVRTIKLDPEDVFRHARKGRELMQEKLKDFAPGPTTVAKKRFFDVVNDRWLEQTVMIQINKTPFGHGAIRECFLMKEVSVSETLVSKQDSGTSPKKRVSLTQIASGLDELRHTERRSVWVAKRAIEGYSDECHRHDCEADVMNQMLAKRCSELFNLEVRRCALEKGIGRCGAHNIDFLMTHVIELEDGSTFGVEAFIFGHYEKHNNNSGATMGGKLTPQAFSYFSFIQSNRRHMVVDIQGIDDLFTDPVVHFLPSHSPESFKHADSKVNLGIRGFALFLWSHRYNNIDRLLGLPVFPLSQFEHAALPAVDKVKIMDMATVAAVDGRCQEDVDVELTSVPDVELRPEMWEALPKPASYSPRPGTAVPLEMVEAACHMEIAIMYGEGRLTADSNGRDSLNEVYSAVFHLTQAAKMGLQEALLALARIAYGRSDDTFLSTVSASDSGQLRALVLVLLARAAAAGSIEAHGALGRELLDGGDGTAEEMRKAAQHLEQFAKLRLAADEVDEGGIAEEDDEELHGAHEASSRHGDSFSWEGHGWLPHNALARAAELYNDQLKKDDGAKAKARDLWELAAEVALENPCLAKQAMRYTERAETVAAELEAAEEEEEEEPAREVSPNDGDGLVPLRLAPSTVDQFLAFAATFGSQDEAMLRLLQLAETRPIADSTRRPDAITIEAVKTQGPSACNEVDEDIWSMIA
eukprot:TRINITY_DN15735_c0_g2_i1.p1 TRINITY_DN15735_c0_g2~~TRINITY_DN15735_c0_g2_i1.p1  ORF type:complete len:741 (+),score=163.74 TRINITY_DN15735_c0_g2_i1:76-2298(+)